MYVVYLGKVDVIVTSHKIHLKVKVVHCGFFFQTGGEDWFLLTTEESLGELETLDVWLDFTGLYPSW